MVKLNINQEYSLKIGEAEPTDSFYLGIKRHRGGINKHVFLIYGLSNRSYMSPRFYLGSPKRTTFKEGIVNIKRPIFRKINSLEERLLVTLIDKLKEQYEESKKNQ